MKGLIEHKYILIHKNTEKIEYNDTKFQNR